MTAPPPPLHRVFVLYFISTYRTINICLCYRRSVPNIPPRIPDRPYSGRLNWASPTQQWHTRQLVLLKMQQSETTSGKASSRMMDDGEPDVQGWLKKSSVTRWEHEDLLKRASYILISAALMSKIVDICRQWQESREVETQGGTIYAERRRNKAVLCEY